MDTQNCSAERKKEKFELQHPTPDLRRASPLLILAASHRTVIITATNHFKVDDAFFAEPTSLQCSWIIIIHLARHCGDDCWCSRGLILTLTNLELLLLQQPRMQSPPKKLPPCHWSNLWPSWSKQQLLLLLLLTRLVPGTPSFHSRNCGEETAVVVTVSSLAHRLYMLESKCRIWIALLLSSTSKTLKNAISLRAGRLKLSSSALQTLNPNSGVRGWNNPLNVHDATRLAC